MQTTFCFGLCRFVRRQFGAFPRDNCVHYYTDHDNFRMMQLDRALHGTNTSWEKMLQCREHAMVGSCDVCAFYGCSTSSVDQFQPSLQSPNERRSVRRCRFDRVFAPIETVSSKPVSCRNLLLRPQDVARHLPRISRDVRRDWGSTQQDAFLRRLEVPRLWI